MLFTYSSDVYYLIALLLVSGGLTMLLDVKGYQSAGHKKEEKTSRALAWINIGLAASLLLVSSIFKM